MTPLLKSASLVDDRFVLEVEASRGGMGTVWKARDLQTSQPVAVKFLQDTSSEQCRRFVRERQLLAELRHPNIVSYVSHGALGEHTPYLAMEWLEGETLAARLARAPLALQETLTVLRGALAGLAVAHCRGIVHRDLKPSNLFLRRAQIDQVVLLDLGLARYAGSDSALTRTGSILGTPSYMAPEQAQGERETTSAADMFSLGCVLFECLTGSVPFVAAHVVAVLAKVLFEPAPRLRDLRPDLPADLDALLARLLDKDPRRRIPDAAALLAELEGLGRLPTAHSRSESPRSGAGEQELVGVILVNDAWDGAVLWQPRDPGGDETSTLLARDLPAAAWTEVPEYGGELKRLADGTSIVVVAQRGGAATDLTARAARCALYLRAVRPEFCYALATGRGVAREHGYVGSAVERAATILRALEGQAAGSIWLDETTSHLLPPRFRRRRMDHASVAFALELEEVSVDPARLLLGRPTPCVGRERELGTLSLSLHACLDEAAPQATLVVGPPGIGKSRLRHEFLRRSQLERDLTVLLGMGDPMRSAATCGLIGQALARLCGLRSDASTEDNHAALAARIGVHLPGDSGLVLAFIAELCGLPEPLVARPELRAARQQPAAMLERLTQSWFAFVRAESARQPLVIVLDDLQWCDALSIGLIDATLRQFDLRVMVLALGRPETLELFPGLWAPRLALLPLQPLPPSATRRLIREVLGDRVGDETMDRMVAHAGGNALYLEELIRAAEAGHAAAPETVLAMLQARIGLLPPAARRVLRAASVFGEYFPLDGVAALLVDGVSRDELLGLLAMLGKHELLEPRSADGSSQQLRFRHALLRDAAYALITEEDLRVAHAIAARHLESVEEDPVVIATHCERGGDTPRAVRHYAAAARQAHRRRDVRATLALVQRCEQLGASGTDLGVLRNLECLARFYLHDLSGAWAAANAALELLPSDHPQHRYAVASTTYVALQIGRMAEVLPLIDELLMGEPDDGDRAEWAVALGYASIAYITQADRPRARQLLACIERVARDSDADDVFVRGQVCYWQVRFQVLLGDDPSSTLLVARRGAAYLEQAGDLQITCAMWAEVGECTRRACSLPECVPDLRKAVEYARACREPVSVAFVSTYLANALAELATPESIEEALALSHQILTLTSEGSAYRALGHASCALSQLRAGELLEAERHARTGHAEIRALGMRAYYPHFDCALLHVLLARGDFAAAASVADDALRNADENGPLGLLEPALRVAAARARLAAGRQAEATLDVRRCLAGLAARLRKIDASQRERACVEVPENAELIAIARELGVGFEVPGESDPVRGGP